MPFGFLIISGYHLIVLCPASMLSNIQQSASDALEVTSIYFLFFNVHYFYLCYVNVSHFTVKNFLLIFQLTSLLSEIGLNIQEAHAFSTVDGYSLDVFVVDGWPLQVFLLLYNGL